MLDDVVIPDGISSASTKYLLCNPVTRRAKKITWRRDGDIMFCKGDVSGRRKLPRQFFLLPFRFVLTTSIYLRPLKHNKYEVGTTYLDLLAS